MGSEEPGPSANLDFTMMLLVYMDANGHKSGFAGDSVRNKYNKMAKLNILDTV